MYTRSRRLCSELKSDGSGALEKLALRPRIKGSPIFPLGVRPMMEGKGGASSSSESDMLFVVVVVTVVAAAVPLPASMFRESSRRLMDQCLVSCQFVKKRNIHEGHPTETKKVTNKFPGRTYVMTSLTTLRENEIARDVAYFLDERFDLTYTHRKKTLSCKTNK